jgi:DUF4097 and DUF4098 domain-containing protein YvlB
MSGDFDIENVNGGIEMLEAGGSGRAYALNGKVDANARQPVVEDSRGKGGKYRVRLERAIYGSINGGGPEIQFKDFNGNIYIRKGK